MPYAGDPIWLADVLRAEGIPVVEMDGWRDRGHGDFADVWGVLWHHMGVNGQGPNVIRDGVPGLDGPIANIHIALDGTVTLVAVGVAWHAGLGSWPGLPTNNANNRLIGVEMAGNGTDPWPAAVWNVAVKLGAAVSRFLLYGADRNIAHKEWGGKAQGKWDPGNWDMIEFRKQIQARLSAPTTPPPLPVPDVTDIEKCHDANGWLGNKLTDERELPTPAPREAGRYAHYVNGSIYWSPATGAHAIPIEIRDRYQEEGWETSELGFPKADRFLAPDGVVQEFEGGTIYHRNADQGAFIVKGTIRELYRATDYERGDLHWPISDESDWHRPLPDGPVVGKVQEYDGGRVFWQASTNTAIAVTREGMPIFPLA